MSGFSNQELLAIFAMQGFAGVSFFSVLLLMALGLAIIYGQMRVINMAHGEFMVIGAYATCLCSITLGALPGMADYYLFFAIPAAFGCAFLVGYVVEIVLIRHLYHRPFGYLAGENWGLALIMSARVSVCFWGSRGERTSAGLATWLLPAHHDD